MASVLFFLTDFVYEFVYLTLFFPPVTDFRAITTSLSLYATVSCTRCSALIALYISRYRFQKK